MTKIAIVGCGYWGNNLIRNFNKVADIDTVCDIDQGKLDSIKENYPAIKITTDFNDILNNPKIKAVVIALPTKFHYEFAKKSLIAGKHILVEKPMTTNSQEAEELIKIAEKKGKILMVDHTFLYHSPILKIKEIIDSGELGKIYYYDSQRMNLGTIRPDINVVWDLASHDISILNFLFKDKPTEVSAIGSSHISKQEEVAHIVIKYQKGIVAHIHLSWLSPIKIRQILIGGSEKMVYFDDIEPSNKIKVYDNAVQVLAYNPKEALLRVCETFIDCIRNNKKPLTDGYEDLKTIKILEVCDKSLKEKCRVHIPKTFQQ